MSIFHLKKNKSKLNFNFIIGTFVLIFAIWGVRVLVADAAINQQINYQGKLTDNAGVAVADGLYNIEFKLYVNNSTTTPVWTETDTGANKVQVTNGLFSVMLGSTTAFTGVDFNQTLYLGVNIGGTGAPSYDGEMSPRKKLGAVPAAIQSQYLNGLSSDQFLRADAINSTNTASTFLDIRQLGTGHIATFTGTSSVIALDLLSNGNVGIGTSSPSAKLDIYGTAGSADIFAISSSTNARLFTVNAAGNVGIGTSTPSALLHVYTTSANSPFKVTQSNATVALTLNLDSYGGTNVNAGGGVLARYARGTDALPTDVVAGDRLGFNIFGGYAGSAFRHTSGIEAIVDSGTVSTTSLPTYLRFLTTADGSVSRTERLRITSGGNVGIGTTSPSAKLAITGTSGATTDIFAIASSTNIRLFTITAEGNVGIGSSSPAFPLSVSGIAYADYGYFGSASAAAWPKDYLSGAQYPSLHSVYAVSPFGLAGGVFASRARDNTGGTSSAVIGADFLAVNDHPTVAHTAWGIYVEADTEASGNQGLQTFGAEISVGNHWTSVSTTPYLDNVPGGTFGLRVDSGTSTIPGTFTSVTAAIQITPNGGLFNSGIIISADAISTSTDPTPPAIALAKNNAISWYSSNSAPNWKLYSEATSGSNKFILGNTTAAISSSFGIGTSSASARLDIYGTSSAPTTDLFAVSSSSNARIFTVTANGRLGLATTSPWSRLSIGTGDAVQMYNTTTAQELGIRIGTTASPDQNTNPGLKVERILSITDAIATANSINGDGVEAYSAIVGIAKGVSGTEVQPVGVSGFGLNDSTSNPGGGGENDALGVYGVGRITGSGTGAGIGGFFLGRRDNDTGKYTGAEIDAANYGTLATTYNTTGYSPTAIWSNALGNANTAAAHLISNAFGRQFQVGLGFTGQNTGGFIGGIASSSIQDDSTSERSILINGTHSKAAIAIAAGSGNVGIGTTTPTFYLDVVAGIGVQDVARFIATSTKTQVVLENSAANSFGTFLTFLKTNNQAWSMGLDSNDSSKFKISTNQANFNSTKFTINTAGLVGIGVTSPTATLDVYGTSTAPTTDIFAVSSSSNSRIFTVAANGNIGLSVSAPTSKLDVGGTLTTTSGGDALLKLSGTVSSSNTGQINGFYNGSVITPTGASVSSVFGLINLPTIANSSAPISNVFGTYSRVDTAASYTGLISSGYGFYAGAPTQSGTLPFTNYSGFVSAGFSNGNGTTSGTINNYGYLIGGHTAAAGSGGTVNNFGGQIFLGSGSGAGTTNNYGLYITGNGGTGGAGTTNNYSIYNGSAAKSYFAGSQLIASPTEYGRFTVTGSTTDTTSRTIAALDSSNRLILEMFNSGRMQVIDYSTGGIFVLYNQATAANGNIAGHYAFGAKDSAQNTHTTGRFNNYITNISSTSLSSRLELQYMDNVNGAPGGVYAYQQPNKTVSIDSTGFYLPNIPLKNTSGALSLENLVYVASSTGTVGIGTTTPSAKLDIYGTSSTPTTDLLAISSSSNTRLVTVTASGNLGLGTSTPAAKLDVNGDVWLEGLSRYLNFGTVATGTNGYGFRDNAGTMQFKNSAGSWTTIGGVGAGTPSGSDGYVQFSTTGAFNADSNFFWDNTNKRLGIGTTSPSEKLTVMGNVLVGSQASTTATWTTRSTAVGQIRSAGTTGIGSTTVMTVFNGSLYAGTASSSGAAEIYRFDSGTSNWTKVSQATAGTIASGGTAAITSIASMIVYNGQLYIGTGKTGAAEVYRYGGGTTWSLISSSTAGAIGGTATTTAIDAVSAMTVNGGFLYIGTQKTGGAEVYRYDVGTGNNNNWTKVSHLTNAGTIGATTLVDKISAMATYLGTLYVAGNKLNAAGLYRYDGPGATPGNGFTILNTAGTFAGQSVAITAVDSITSMSNFNGKLYLGISDGAGTARVLKWDSTAATAAGATNVFQVVSSSTVGVIAEDVGATTGIDSIGAMGVYKGNLYVGTVDTSNTAEVYQLDIGNNWTRVSSTTAGVITGAASNAITGVYSINIYNGDLWFGTGKANGAEVYSYNFIGQESYNLMFNANSGQGGGEVNGNLNTGTIQFFGDNNSFANTGNLNTGVFRFSHGINTAFGAYDIAEDYPTRDDTLEAGDVISIDVHEHGLVTKSSGTNDKNVIGIYSKNPALRLSQQDATIDGATAIPVALAGRVPVKVTLENGPIVIGDYLMTSTEPGKAAKATHPGRVVGRAMSAYDGSDSTEAATVMVFIGMETISSNDLDNATTTLDIASSTIDMLTETGDDLMSKIVDLANTSISDIAMSITSVAQNISSLVVNKITVIALNVKQAFVKVLAILPGGSIFVPSGTNELAGVGFIATSTMEVFIENNQIDQNSNVFLTPTSATDVPLFVAEKRAGQGFLVRIVHPAQSSISFDWFFVKTYKSKDDADNQISTIISSTNTSTTTDDINQNTSTTTTTSTTLSIDENRVSSEGATSTVGVGGAGDSTPVSSNENNLGTTTVLVPEVTTPPVTETIIDPVPTTPTSVIPTVSEPVAPQTETAPTPAPEVIAAPEATAAPAPEATNN